MSSLDLKVKDFLSQKRIAVAGVTRSQPNEAANLIYKKLRSTGYEVFAINPNAETVEGDPCYPALESLPSVVDGVVISTRPEITDQVIQDCIKTGVKRVWIHRSFGPGSLSDSAVKTCEENQIMVIPGGCPMMFAEPVDFAHKCMRFISKMTGSLPK